MRGLSLLEPRDSDADCKMRLPEGLLGATEAPNDAALPLREEMEKCRRLDSMQSLHFLKSA